MSFTPAQCRAARALLDWSQGELADASGVATKTIADFERGQRTPYDRTLADIQKALEAAGIEFTNGGRPGVRISGDRTYGFLYDGERIVGRIENGEVRRDAPGQEVIALVRKGRLHDPETGEFICNLVELGVGGNPLPSALKAKLR